MRRLARVLPAFSLALATGGAVTAQTPAAPPRLSLSTPLGDDVFVVEGFRGEESISSLFSFQIDLASAVDRGVPFEALLGRDLRLTIALHGGETRVFNGICSRVSQGDTDAAAHFRVEMVPRLWLLTKRSRSRIFQEMSVPQVVAQVFAEHGIDFRMQLEGVFSPRPYCVQYRESDFDFASRLLEEEGIYYYFQHAADGHTLVLANSPEGHPDLPGTFRYVHDGAGAVRPRSIQSWTKTQEMRSGKLTLRDHQFQLPGKSLEATESIQPTVAAGEVLHQLDLPGASALEVYDYPGGYAERFDGVGPSGEERPEVLLGVDEDAQRTARLRVQEQAAGALVVRGMSAAPTLAPGHRFALAGHPDADGAYVLTSVGHQARAAAGDAPGEYKNTFTCIPAGLPFRPARTTLRPVVAGLQSAVVVGPPGEDVFTDKYARVKVQFHWDREGRSDAGSSCWIRVGALNAGTESGLTHVPEIGDEVLVSFLDGDPDRPVIVGSVYNPDRPPPPSRATEDR